MSSLWKRGGKSKAKRKAAADFVPSERFTGIAPASNVNKKAPTTRRADRDRPGKRGILGPIRSPLAPRG